MALINSNGKYIKLSKNGYYEVYASEVARRKVKQSTPGETILLKYQELLSELMQPDKDEFRYYDPEGFAALYDPLNEEYHRYWYNFDNHIIGQDYPIMSEIYPDVAGSIPEIVEAAYIPTLSEELDELYLEAKQLKRFGETTDA